MFAHPMIETMETRRMMAVDVFTPADDASIGLLLPAVETASTAGTGGGGAGKVSMQDIHFTVKVDKATPIHAT